MSRVRRVGSLAGTVFVSLGLIGCGEPEENDPPQPSEEHCRSLDSEPEACRAEAWCDVALVSRYEVEGGTCEQVWSGEMCLRLTEPKRAGQVIPLQVNWGLDTDGNIMTVNLNPGYRDVRSCDSRCDSCLYPQ